MRPVPSDSYRRNVAELPEADSGGASARSRIVLGGYPAKWCPRRTHNDFAPDSPEPLPTTLDLQRLFDEGNYFEKRVTAALVDALGDRVTIIGDFDRDYAQAIDATITAIERGASVIVNGRLPRAGNRAGAPDLLVKTDNGYLPVDIKNHRTRATKKRGTLVYATLAEPTERLNVVGLDGGGSHRADDTMQLAHYTRMLQELDYHPGGQGDEQTWLWGGIIGSDDYGDLTSWPLGITWYDLGVAVETTYSASTPGSRAKRSPMERYDHEFAFRVKVAEAAATGQELVRPVGIAECPTCEWLDYCTSIAAPDDASFAIVSPSLDAREWLFLAGHGGGTVAGLADLDADDIAAEYKLHAVGRQAPEARLRDVINQARLTRDGIDIEPLGHWPLPPAADLEVDFDIEWDRDQRIYQWGLRIRDGHDDSTARYEPILSFDPLDDDTHAALASEFATKLAALLKEADTAGRTVTIFHWSHAEISRARQFPELSTLLDGRTLDLCTWVKERFRARGNYSIKNIAPIFGFNWNVDDPGGFGSMAMIEAARLSGSDGCAAREWCLAYNESDVAAQAAIRDGIRARASGALVRRPS